MSTTTITQTDEAEMKVRDIVGRSYAKTHGSSKERFDPARSLILSAIPGSRNTASHVAINITGTPPRGLVIVDMMYENIMAVDFYSNRKLSESETHFLRSFISSKSPYPNVPSRWFWSSADPGPDGHGSESATDLQAGKVPASTILEGFMSSISPELPQEPAAPSDFTQWLVDAGLVSCQSAGSLGDINFCRTCGERIPSVFGVHYCSSGCEDRFDFNPEDGVIGCDHEGDSNHPYG